MFLEFVTVRWSVERLTAYCGAVDTADGQGMLQAQQQVRDSFGATYMSPFGGGSESRTASDCTRILHLRQCFIAYAHNLTSAFLDHHLTLLPSHQLLQILARPFSAQPAPPRPSAHPFSSKEPAQAAAGALSSSSSKAASLVKKNALVAAGVFSTTFGSVTVSNCKPQCLSLA
jgi:hypothetical protein